VDHAEYVGVGSGSFSYLGGEIYANTFSLRSYQEAIEEGRLSEGHGRAILSAPDVPTMARIARIAAEKGLSVREVERRARAAARKDEPGAGPPKRSANVRDLEMRLSRALGSKTTVKDNKGKGRIEISYASFEELDRLLEKLLR